MRIAVFLSFVLLSASFQAGAENFLDGSWYASPMMSYIDDDDARDVDDGLSGYHLGIGKDLSSLDSLEISLVLAFHNADGFDGDQEQRGIGIDYVRRFLNTEHFVPYGLVGGGYMKTQNKNASQKDGSGLMTSIGVGVLTPLKWFDLMLRTELRFRTDYSVSTRQDFLLSFGLHRALKPKPILLLDDDKDGVVDSQDRCEDTPRIATVDSHGCARIRDRDGDGVSDEKDRCGGSRPDADVDDYGCVLTPTPNEG